MKEVTRIELVRAGKYHVKGELRPLECTNLPFHVAGTINESKGDRKRAQRDMLMMMPRDDIWRNVLVWGDNSVVMSSLMRLFAAKMKFIHINHLALDWK